MPTSGSKESSDLHVVTENGEQCFMWRSNQLTYIAQDRQELPLVLATKFGPLATKLDLSYNTLTSYRNISLFTNLSELILDNNHLDDPQLDGFKQNLRLKTLSLNKNKVCFPNLEYLSLIGNPLCPAPVPLNLSNEKLNKQVANLIDLVDGFKIEAQLDRQQQEIDFVYQKYRYFIIYHLPNLRFLDSNPITGQERDEALKRCHWMDLNAQQTSLEENIIEESNGRHNNAHNEATSSSEGFRLSIMSENNLDSQLRNDTTQPKGAFSRLSYKYTGKNSEGNRFIRNNDL